MLKWTVRLVLLGVIGFVGYAAYDLHRGGYFDIPDLAANEYPISFRSGFRAIVIDPEVNTNDQSDAPKFFRRLGSANTDRRYLGVPFEVAYWQQDAWSYCTKPSDDERKGFFNSLPDNWQKTLERARLEGVCRTDVEGEKVLRGLVYSVPKL
jgi:hypothetical protein